MGPQNDNVQRDVERESMHRIFVEVMEEKNSMAEYFRPECSFGFSHES